MSSRVCSCAFGLSACLALLAHPARLSGAEAALEGVTAVASKVSSDYVRAKAPDGSFLPEYYSFGAGGKWGGEISDPTIDKVRFLDVAHVIAGPLAGQKYLPATDPKATRLLIMVYWGTTVPPVRAEEDPMYNNYQQALDEYRILMESKQPEEADAVLTAGLKQLSLANHVRDEIDFKNAKMLGYDADGLIGTEYGKYIEHTALGLNQKDEVAEIEEHRYFVVLMAYDFQMLWKEKKHKLLWETRFSISERRNAFDAALPFMAHYASRYFGRDSHGLLREAVPEGTVQIGEVKSIGVVDEPKK
jgi:hypothetical protein